MHADLQQLYRLLADHPGTHVTSGPLAAALRRPVDDITTGLHHLFEHTLLTDAGPGRFAVPDAVRGHALALSDDLDTTELRLARIRRMISWYMRRTATADLAIAPITPRFSEVFETLTRTAGFRTAHAAQDWFEAEQDTVLTALTVSDRHRWDELTVQLAEALGNLLRIGYQPSKLVWSQRLGLVAATRIGHGHPLAAVFAARIAIGLSHLGEHDAAITVADDAVTRAQAGDDPAITAMALSARGRAHLYAGQSDRANRDLIAALNIAVVHGHFAVAGQQHRLLGQMYLSAASPDTDGAVSSLRTAVRMLADAGDRAGQVRAMTDLADALAADGRADAAQETLLDASQIRACPRSARYTAHTERVTACIHQILGDTDQAIEHATTALAATTTAIDASADHDRAVITALLKDIITPMWIAPPLCDTCPNVGKVAALLAGRDADWPLERRWIERTLAPAMPEFGGAIQARQAFRARAVDYALACGVNQILAIGSGFPDPNPIHAQVADHPTARVVYADWEIQAYATMALATHDNGQVHVVQGDFRVPESILASPQTLSFLDFDRPVCLVLTGLLEHCEPGTDLADVLGRYITRLAPGSVVILSHLTLDGLDPTIPQQLRVLRQLLAVRESYQDTHFPPHVRTRYNVARIVEELELVEPGITWTTSWPATDPAPGPAAALPVCFAAVGRVR